MKNNSLRLMDIKLTHGSFNYKVAGTKNGNVEDKRLSNIDYYMMRSNMAFEIEGFLFYLNPTPTINNCTEYGITCSLSGQSVASSPSSDVFVLKQTLQTRLNKFGGFPAYINAIKKLEVLYGISLLKIENLDLSIITLLL